MLVIALLAAALSFLVLILLGAFDGSARLPATALPVIDDPQSFDQVLADLMWTK